MTKYALIPVEELKQLENARKQLSKDIEDVRLIKSNQHELNVNIDNESIISSKVEQFKTISINESEEDTNKKNKHFSSSIDIIESFIGTQRREIECDF